MKLGDPPHHSSDLRWWWDGTGWRPALSPDGSGWFNGSFWVMRPEFVPTQRADARAVRPSWVRRAQAAWLVSMSLVALGALVSAPTGRPPSHRTLVVLSVAGGLSVAGCLPLGFALGRFQLWLEVLLTAVGGTGVGLVWYVAAMVQYADPSDLSTDNAVGAGAVILGAPTFLALVALTGLSAVIGHATRRFGSRVARGHDLQSVGQ